MKELTKAEEQIMQLLWDMDKAFINDLLAKFPDPKPAYNTVSTIVRILEKKGFIGHTAYGKTFEYYPLISKKEYTQKYFRNFFSNYFSNSYEALGSFFAQEADMSIQDLEDIKKIMEEEIQKQKSKNTE